MTTLDNITARRIHNDASANLNRATDIIRRLMASDVSDGQRVTAAQDAALYLAEIPAMASAQGEREDADAAGDAWEAANRVPKFDSDYGA